VALFIFYFLLTLISFHYVLISVFNRYLSCRHTFLPYTVILPRVQFMELAGSRGPASLGLRSLQPKAKGFNKYPSVFIKEFPAAF